MISMPDDCSPNNSEEVEWFPQFVSGLFNYQAASSCVLSDKIQQILPCNGITVTVDIEMVLFLSE